MKRNGEGMKHGQLACANGKVLERFSFKIIREFVTKISRESKLW